MKKTILLFLFFSMALFTRAQDFSPMVRELNELPLNAVLINDNSNIILSDYHNEEVLVIVEDILGNDIYSKIVFKNQCAVLKAEDPYARIPSGVYTIIGTSRNEIYNQKIVVD